MRPSELDPERWRQIDEVFEAALDIPPAERAEFLAEACAGDGALRAQVEALIDASERVQPRFEAPASPLGAAILASVETGPEGRLVGPFRILREVGRGGMGVVYLAEDTRLGRHVALKALPPYLGVGPEAKRRFRAEARAVSALDHPNIATLYEIGEAEQGQLYMAFAYYEGETLEVRIGRGPLPVAEAVEIATGIAEGLAAAHGAGIIHRDVKPSNVLLTEGGEVKLLDFGVAKVAGEELTGEGVRLGTVAYMSPEQASGAPVDRRSDLWSLGVVLHQMLMGERPFRGSDQPSLVGSILHDGPEPLAREESGIPEGMGRVVEKLLCKVPDGRYQRAEDLLDDLQALGAGKSPPVVIRDPPLPKSARGGSRLRSAVGSRGWRRASVVAVGLGAAAGGLWVASNASGTASRIEGLAVLPLTNLTGDTARQYYVDGVHDALIAELGKIGTVDVLSRTTMMRYRDTRMSVPEIAEELEVDAVVEGSVLQEGDSLAITAQLIAVSPERHLWAETYRRGVGGVFEITGQVARSIAAEIEGTLSPAEETRLMSTRSVDPAAYDAYTLGQVHLERRSPGGFEMAQRYLRRAIEIDSSFAPAYTSLADAYGSAAFFGLGSPAETMPVVRNLAERALAIDSSLAAAHNILGAVKLYWDWDWEGAEREARRAIAINPSFPGAHRRLSEVLAVRGRYQEALEAVERGSDLERLVPFSAFRPVVVLIYMGDFEEAIERARAGLEFFTDFWAGHWLLCRALAGEGLYIQAVEACEEAAVLSRRTSAALGSLGYAYAAAGRHEAAHRVLQGLEARAEAQYVGASNFAMIHAGLGERDRAFEWLDRSYEERDIQLVHIANYPVFHSLRSDPRFADLLRRMGLEERLSVTEG